jgi:hypothetical protein
LIASLEIISLFRGITRSPGNSFLESQIRVVPRSNVGNMRGGTPMTGSDMTRYDRIYRIVFTLKTRLNILLYRPIVNHDIYRESDWHDVVLLTDSSIPLGGAFESQSPPGDDQHLTQK